MVKEGHTVALRLGDPRPTGELTRTACHPLFRSLFNLTLPTPRYSVSPPLFLSINKARLNITSFSIHGQHVPSAVGV